MRREPEPMEGYTDIDWDTCWARSCNFCGASSTLPAQPVHYDTCLTRSMTVKQAEAHIQSLMPTEDDDKGEAS